MIVQLPNGETAEFPDNMNPGEIESVLQKQFKPPVTQPQAQTGPAQTDSPWSTIKDVGSALYEGSPIPGVVDAAKLATLPFRPSSYQGISEAAQQPFFSQEGIGGQLGKGALNVLPMAGGLAGGAIGTAAGGGLMSPILGTAGMGLGYSIGDRAKKLLETYFGLYKPKSLTEEFKQTVLAIGTGAKAYMQGESGTKMLTMAGSPLAGQFAKQGPWGDTARLGADMVEGGLPLSPDVYAPSMPTRFLQWATDNIIPGGNILANQRRKVVSDTISQMRQDFIESAGLPSPFTPMAKSKALEKEAYQVFNQEGKGAQIPFNNTLNFIQENIDNPALQTSGTLKQKVLDFQKKAGGTGEKSEMLFSPGEVPVNQMPAYQGLSNIQTSGSGTATIGDINDLLPYLWSKTKSTNQFGKGKNQYEKLTDESIQLRNGLKDAIDADLGAHEVDTGSKVLESLNTAREAVKTSADLAKSKYLEKLLESSTDFNPETQQFEFQPGKFYVDVLHRKETLQNKFPDQFENIMQFAEKSKLASADVARLSPKPGWKQALEYATAAGQGTAIYGNPILAVPLAFPAFASYSLMNPSGIVRKFLTTGIKPPTLTKETIQLGVMNKKEE